MFDDDVTMFTQPWYDLLAKLAKLLAAKYGPWPKCPLGYAHDGVITKFGITVRNSTFLRQNR